MLRNCMGHGTLVALVRLHHEYFAGLATDKKKIKVHQTSFIPAVFVERARRFSF